MGTTIAPLPSAAVALRIPKSLVRHLPTAARVLMGALFLFTGVLGLVMAPQPTPGLPAGAVAFTAALAKTGYMVPLVSAAEAIVGLLLVANRFVPLALALLAPVVVNIFAFHLFLEPGGRPIAVVLCALELYLAWVHRDAYRPMLAMRARRGAAPTY